MDKGQTPAVDETLDPAFYLTYYRDLVGLTPKQAERHFKTWGRQEGRKGNARQFLADLERQFGSFPKDFNAEKYLSMHRDVQAIAPTPLHAAQHYMEHGRKEGRPYSSVNLRESRSRLHDLTHEPPPALVHRSWIADRGQALRIVFGEAFSETLLRAVMSNAQAIAKHPSVGSPLLHDIVIARYLLSAPSGYRSDFTTPQTQLAALFISLFGCPDSGRSTVEMDAVNTLARRAMEIEVGVSGAWPALTLFMLAARSTLCGADPNADMQNPGAAAAAFFGRDVAELRLERFVTSQQRSLLRSTGPGGRILALACCQIARAENPYLKAVQRSGRDMTDWFWSEGLWVFGMDYILSGQQLRAAQVAVEERDPSGGFRLKAPYIAFEDPEANISNLDPATAHDWLRRFVYEGREACGLPQIITSPSALAYLRGVSPRAPSTSGPQPSRTGKAAYGSAHTGDVITFCSGGNGEDFLVGRGWHRPESAGTRILETTAQIAFRFEAPDEAEIDLFLELAVDDLYHDLHFWVIWNGWPASQTRFGRFKSQWIHCHMGPNYRPPPDINVLGLSIRGVYPGSIAARGGGVSLRQMMIVQR
jgi:hypothetical protein